MGLGPDVIKLLYTAVVEPVVLYGASVGPGLAKTRSEEAARCRPKRLCAKADEGLQNRLTKLGPTARRNIAPRYTCEGERLPIRNKEGYSRRVVGDREVERPVAYGELEHPAQRSMVRYRCLADGAEVNQITSQCLCIYTDGSKIQDRVGAAISIWENAAETRSKKFKMESFCTVYQAELLALHGATEEAVKSGGNLQRPERLEGGAGHRSRRNFLHPLAFKIRKNLRTLKERNKIINLFWIKAHAGDGGK
ncbi:uncharacterized protein LOC119188787 [Manduca sexta]|uniref:uncharacterized protein LOC119188787 n=1 Tax=Manduca sexta TaxID=7130 RepID=UPI001890789C|nr:uncharacterized protein LOC119188787 [Manduca sexta]